MCVPGCHGHCVLISISCLRVAVVVVVARVFDSQPHVLGQASLSKKSNSEIIINGMLLIEGGGGGACLFICVWKIISVFNYLLESTLHLCRLLSPIVNSSSL